MVLSYLLSKVNSRWMGLVKRFPRPTQFFLIFAGGVFEQEFREWWQELAGMEH